MSSRTQTWCTSRYPSSYIVLSIVAAGKRGSDQDRFLSFLKSKSVDDLNSLAYHLITCVLADGSDRPKEGHVWTWPMVYVQTSDNSYKEVACRSYKATLKQVDFKANPEKVRVEVNSWVEKETQGLITDILSPNSVTDLTRRIFASALYFKGSWSEHYDFYEPYTYSEEENHHEFHLLNGDTIKGVPFMTSRAVTPTLSRLLTVLKSWNLFTNQIMNITAEAEASLRACFFQTQ